MSRRVKVAVVGSGLAGLTAAHLLKRPTEDDGLHFEIHIFEKVRACAHYRSVYDVTVDTIRLPQLAWTPHQSHC